MTTRHRLLLLALPALLLAGCSPSPAAPAEAELAELGEVASLDALREAYEGTGGPCTNWDQSNVVTLAAESGSCDTNTVLSTYSSEGDRDSTVAALREFADMVDMHLLVGPNWIINDEKVKELRDELGGTVIVKEATE